MQTACVKAKPHFVLIVGFGVASRAFYHLTYRPWWCGDSGGYSNPPWLWFHHQFSDGARTPVYPLFLVLAQGLAGTPVAPRISVAAANVATILQSLLGIVAACMIYDILRRLRVHSRIALVSAILFAVLPGVCQFEMMILTESLSLFVNVASVWFLVRTVNRVRSGEKAARRAVLTGVLFGVGILIRPESLVFAAVLAILLALVSARLYFRAAKNALASSLGKSILAMSLGAVPVVIAWMTLNYVGIGQFRLTTLSGWDKSASVYNLFDRVGPEDKVAGDIIQKSYLSRNRGGPPVRDHIWGVAEELIARRAEFPVKIDSRRVSVDVGDYIGRVSLKLMRRYPRAWLKNIESNFIHETFDFRYAQTDPLNTIDPQTINGGNVVRYKSLWRITVWANNFAAPFLKVLYIVLILWALLNPWLLLRARTSADVRCVLVSALAVGTVAVFVVACVFACYNKQYGVPYLPIIIICGAVAMQKVLTLTRGTARDVASSLGLKKRGSS